MNAAILAAALLLTTAAPPGPERLWGTWRLVAFTRSDGAGASTDVWGKDPRGYLTYGRDGRMSVVLVKTGRPRAADAAQTTDAERAELFRTLVAYAGTYTFDGEKVVHHIEVSANESWTGTDQVRHVKLDGSRLVLTTDPTPSAFDGKTDVRSLVFERVGGR
jgi:hypothetical protein